MLSCFMVCTSLSAMFTYFYCWVLFTLLLELENRDYRISGDDYGSIRSYGWIGTADVSFSGDCY